MQDIFGIYPTSPFTFLEKLNPSHDAPELHKIRQSTDFKAPILCKGSSGTNIQTYAPPSSLEKNAYLFSTNQIVLVTLV